MYSYRHLQVQQFVTGDVTNSWSTIGATSSYIKRQKYSWACREGSRLVGIEATYRWSMQKGPEILEMIKIMIKKYIKLWRFNTHGN